jgi:hypothetical protein
MLKGVHLSLMIGPAIPVPAPKAVMDALISAQVTNGKDKSGFQLTFGVSKDSVLLKTMLPVGYFDPIITRVIIIATVNGFPHVLMDGMITRQELSPSNEPGQSTLTITGEDLSVLMDIVEMPFMRYPAMPDIAQIYLILAKYLAFGIIPLAIPPIIDVPPIPTSKLPTHKGTDLQYLKKLASSHGYVFYVEPGPAPGASIAYFGPNIRIPVPQPALNVNMDAHSNVDAMTFTLDGLAKKIVVVSTWDPVTQKIPLMVPIPNINIFQPPLGARPTPPAKVEFPLQLATESMPKIIDRVLGVLLESQNAITVSGSLDVLRYGQPLRNRLLVGVRGAGLAYDGMYYVDSVTSNLKRGEFKQSFQLSRDGLIAIGDKVRT